MQKKSDILSLLKEVESINIVNSMNNPITEREIHKNLKNNKSTGIDNISNKMIKYSQHFFVPDLCKIFNRILFSVWYSSTWEKGYIVPI